MTAFSIRNIRWVEKHGNHAHIAIDGTLVIGTTTTTEHDDYPITYLAVAHTITEMREILGY